MMCVLWDCSPPSVRFSQDNHYLLFCRDQELCLYEKVEDAVSRIGKVAQNQMGTSGEVFQNFPGTSEEDGTSRTPVFRCVWRNSHGFSALGSRLNQHCRGLLDPQLEMLRYEGIVFTDSSGERAPTIMD